MRPELALGTVQFGMKYGVAGRGESVPPDEVRRILEFAWNSGVRVLDTAPGYGDIEQRLDALTDGFDFTVVSKIPSLASVRNKDEAIELVESSFLRSRERLGCKLKTVLFHNAGDLFGDFSQAVWDSAYGAARAAHVSLGASCYSAEVAVALTDKFPISAIQVPGNAFDQRMNDTRFAAPFAGVEIHLRSAFLQGLLLQSAHVAASLVPNASSAMQKWTSWCRTNTLSPLEGALSAVKSFANVRYCVVGVDSLEQLESIVDAWKVARAMDIATLACDDETVIDPRTWKSK